MSTNGNGSNRLVWLFATTLLAVVVALVSAWAAERNAVDERLTQRVTALEKQFVSIDEHMKAQDEKLDRLLVGLGLERKR